MTEAALRIALNGLLDLCTMHAAPKAFHNGVTDSTGSIDEGDVRAGEIIDAAQAALALPISTAEPIAYAFELANAVMQNEDRTPTHWDKTPRLSLTPPNAGRHMRNVRALFDHPPVTPAATAILAAFEKPPVTDHDDDLCRNFGRKSFRLTFKVGAYEATHEVEVGGNASGFDNLDCALMNLADRLYNEDAGTAVLTLTNPAGRKLTDTDHKGGCEDWLRELLVSATLFAITPETKDDEQ